MTQAMTQPLVPPPTETLDREELIVALGCEPARDWQKLPEAQVQAQAEDSGKRYFEMQQGERDALSPTELTSPFLTVSVIKHALSIAPGLVPFVDEMKTLPGVRLERLNVRERALSFWHADTRLTYTEKGMSAERLLVDEGKPLRQSIFKWGQAMVEWEVFTEAEWKKLTRGTSHEDLAEDLAFIGERCVERWAKLDTRVKFTRADAERARVIGNELISARATQAAAAAQPGAITATQAKNEHRRAFTLLAQSLEEFRKGLTWLRRDERDFDLDAVCPSMHAVRKKPTSKPKTVEKAPADAN